RKEMHARAKKAAKSCSNDEAREVLESVARVSKEWGDDGAGVFADRDVHKEVASALTALAIDAALEKLLDQAELAVMHRSGQESGRALNSYAKRLDAESGSEAVARSIAAIDERAAARRTELQQQMTQAQAAIRARTPNVGGEDPQALLARVQAELSRLEDERN